MGGAAIMGIVARKTRRAAKLRRFDLDQFNSAKLRSICTLLAISSGSMQLPQSTAKSPD
jgi:hypothetical protein